MKFLLPVLLALVAPLLHAAPKVQLDCTLVSLPKPIATGLPDQKSYYADLRAKGVPFPQNVISINGVFTAEQARILLQSCRRDKARITTLPSQTVSSARTFEIDTMKKGPPSTEVLGDFSKYNIKPVKIEAAPPEDIGIRLSCRPTVGADGYSIDCHFKYRSHLLKGFEETLLTGDGITALRDPSAAASPDFPRIRQPLYTSQEVTTEFTLYDGQTIIFTLRDKDVDPTASIYEYVFISVCVVK